MAKKKSKTTKTIKFPSDVDDTASKVAAAPKPAPAPAKPKKKAVKTKRVDVPLTDNPVLSEPPTEAKMKSLQNYPVVTRAEIAHFRRAPAQFSEVAHDTLSAWQGISSQFMVPGLTVDALANALATFDTLFPIEQEMEPFYERARTNRMKAESDAMVLLYALARAIKGASSPALAEKFTRLLAWIGAPHKKTAKKAAKKASTKTA